MRSLTDYLEALKAIECCVEIFSIIVIGIGETTLGVEMLSRIPFFWRRPLKLGRSSSQSRCFLTMPLFLWKSFKCYLACCCFDIAIVFGDMSWAVVKLNFDVWWEKTTARLEMYMTTMTNGVGHLKLPLSCLCSLRRASWKRQVTWLLLFKSDAQSQQTTSIKPHSIEEPSPCGSGPETWKNDTMRHYWQLLDPRSQAVFESLNSWNCNLQRPGVFDC